MFWVLVPYIKSRAEFKGLIGYEIDRVSLIPSI
jgi:hypothetical protein